MNKSYIIVPVVLLAIFAFFYNGALKDVRPDDLAALAIRAAVERAGVDPASIEDVILGAANQAGEDNRNVARMAALLAGLPVEVPGQTVNRLCGSGLQAIITAAHGIMAGDGDVYVAGGVESMTRAPLVALKPSAAFPRGNMELVDTTIGWRFTNPKLAKLHHPYSMGETAENVAERWQVSRADQDAFALESQRRAVAAIEAGRFDAELVPVEVPGPKGQVTTVARDEHPRADTTLEKLGTLRAAFRDGGSVTAGNASGVNDGATALHFAAGLGWRDGSAAAPSYDQGTEADAVKAIDMLLDLGLSLSDATETGDTPLHSSVTRSSTLIIQHLLDKGADKGAVNKKGLTPFALAKAIQPAVRHKDLVPTLTLLMRPGDTMGGNPLDSTARVPLGSCK